MEGLKSALRALRECLLEFHVQALRVVLSTHLIHHTVGGKEGGREGVKLVRCYSVINFYLTGKYPNGGD